MSPVIPVICHSCGATGSVGRITANLQCRCGSTDIDLYDGEAKTSSQQSQHSWLSNGRYPEDEAERDNGEVNLPDHLVHTYETGYNRGREGQAPLNGFQSEHQSAHDLGYSHGQRDRGYTSSKTAAPHGPGTGWNTTQPDRLQGWDEYQGPAVGRNPLAEQHMTNDNGGICPACGGSGRDSRASGGGYDENTCRLCGGSGRYTPPTGQSNDYLHPEQNDAHSGPASGGARWQASLKPTFSWGFGGAGGSTTYTNLVPMTITYSNGMTWSANGNVTATRKSSDPMGSAEDYIRSSTPGYGGRDDSDKHWNAGPMVKHRPDKDYSHGNKPLQLDQATCPSCRHIPTQIVRNSNDDAVWHCPNCGPLANVDKNPDVNPYDPPFGFKPDRTAKVKSRKILGSRKTGRIFPMVDAVLENNSGLSKSEAFHVARQAVALQKKAEESN